MKEKKSTGCKTKNDPFLKGGNKDGKDKQEQRNVAENLYGESVDMNDEMMATMGLFGSQLDDVACGLGEDLAQGSEFISGESVKSKEK